MDRGPSRQRWEGDDEPPALGFTRAAWARAGAHELDAGAPAMYGRLPGAGGFDWDEPALFNTPGAYGH
jgi:hypothetical protein